MNELEFTLGEQKEILYLFQTWTNIGKTKEYNTNEEKLKDLNFFINSVLPELKLNK